MMTGTTAITLPETSVAEALSCGGADAMAALLEPAGAVLVRAASISGPAGLAELATRLGLVAVGQPEPFAPRRDLGHRVWSQPAWPNNSPMCMHHELGWQRQPPAYLLVACLRPAASGGATGIADGRAVLSLLPDRLVERAELAGWTMLRRFRPGMIGMAWPEAFPGMDDAAVRAYAAEEQIELEWGPDVLVTRRSRPAIRATAPDGALAWSNLLAFCSEWTMEPAVRQYILATLGRPGLPFETTYGDGSPFPAADVETVNAAYDRATAFVSWRAGDVLLLDNVRTAHSMQPYTGEREMAVLHAVAAPARQP